MRVLVGSAALAGPTGAQPDTVAWTPDAKVLLVGEGERNDIVIVDPSKDRCRTPVIPAETVAGATGAGVGTGPGPNRNAVVGSHPDRLVPERAPGQRRLRATSSS